MKRRAIRQAMMAVAVGLVMMAPCARGEDANSAPSPQPQYPERASKAERKALDALAEEVDGKVAFTRKGKVYVVRIGHWKPREMGGGQFARWSPDGNSLAVYDDGKIYRVSVPSGKRKLLAKDADSKNGCPVEFHPDGQDVLYWTKKDGFRAANVKTGKTRSLNLPGKYSGAACLSADGKKMAVRWGHDLYAVDVEKGKHRKYGRGCSPGVSPDGRWLMKNDGGHRTVSIRPWDGKGKKRKIDVRTCKPDRKWDNHHWSNHVDYIAAQGDGKQDESYVVRISANRCTRISWMGKTGYPDVWIRPEKKAEKKAETDDDADDKSRGNAEKDDAQAE
jgi:hypothetical protein